MDNKKWLSSHTENVFVLSRAGKPIYCMDGDEQQLATIFCILQAIISFVENENDNIYSIHAKGFKMVFFVKKYIILVATSKSDFKVQPIELLLVYDITYNHFIL